MKKIWLAIPLICVGIFFIFQNYKSDAITVFSARKEYLIQPLADQFTQQTNIPVNIITGKAPELINRIKNGDQADVIVLSDDGTIQTALNKQIFHNDQYTPISKRLRMVFGKKNDETIDDYADVQNKPLYIRSSKNPYNKTLMALMIIQKGPKYTRQWMENIVQNFPKPPSGGDTDQLKYLAKADVGYAIANHYYYLRLLEKHPDIAAKIHPLTISQGIYKNMSAAAVVKNSNRLDKAQKFIDFLISKEGQKIIAHTNYEIPVIPDVDIPEILKNYISIKTNDIDPKQIYSHLNDASIMADQTGWR